MLSIVAAVLLAPGVAAAPAAVPADSAAPPPAAVTVGAYLNDIQNVDVKSHSYSADVYIWFRWRDPALHPAESFEFMNPYDAWNQTRRPYASAPERLPDGELYQVVRAQGRFRTKFDLSDYPYDHQRLVLEIEDQELPTTGLVYVADSVPFTVNPRLDLPGFRVGAPSVRVLDFRYPTNFGEGPAPLQTYSRMQFVLPLARPALSSTVKLILPVVLVLGCVVLMLLLHPALVQAQLILGITSLLTLVALQLRESANLPPVSYLIFIDKVYLGAFLFAIAGLAMAVRTSWVVNGAGFERAVAFNRRALAALTAVYLVTIVLTFASIR